MKRIEDASKVCFCNGYFSITFNCDQGTRVMFKNIGKDDTWTLDKVLDYAMENGYANRIVSETVLCMHRGRHTGAVYEYARFNDRMWYEIGRIDGFDWKE